MKAVHHHIKTNESYHVPVSIAPTEKKEPRYVFYTAGSGQFVATTLCSAEGSLQLVMTPCNITWWSLYTKLHCDLITEVVAVFVLHAVLQSIPVPFERFHDPGSLHGKAVP